MKSLTLFFGVHSAGLFHTQPTHFILMLLSGHLITTPIGDVRFLSLVISTDSKMVLSHFKAVRLGFSILHP